MNATTPELTQLHEHLTRVTTTLDNALAAAEKTGTALDAGDALDMLTHVTTSPDADRGTVLWEVLVDFRDTVAELIELRPAVDHHDPRVERNRILTKAEKAAPTDPAHARVLIDLAAEWGRS